MYNALMEDSTWTTNSTWRITSYRFDYVNLSDFSGLDSFGKSAVGWVEPALKKIKM